MAKIKETATEVVKVRPSTKLLLRKGAAMRAEKPHTADAFINDLIEMSGVKLDN